MRPVRRDNMTITRCIFMLYGVAHLTPPAVWALGAGYRCCLNTSHRVIAKKQSLWYLQCGDIGRHGWHRQEVFVVTVHSPALAVAHVWKHVQHYNTGERLKQSTQLTALRPPKTAGQSTLMQLCTAAPSLFPIPDWHKMPFKTPSGWLRWKGDTCNKLTFFCSGQQKVTAWDVHHIFMYNFLYVENPNTSATFFMLSPQVTY